MRGTFCPIMLAIIMSAAFTLSARAADSNDAVYELRVYTTAEGKLDALHERFREHTMALFKKHGMENVAYWVPLDEPLSKNTLIYVLRHESREAAKTSWDGFRNDDEWKQVAAASKEKDGQIVTKVDSTYMSATDYSPQIKPPHADSLYELRTYTAAEGKLEALHARFRDHTNKLFQKHGMNPFGYWGPVESPQSENVMIYVIEHPDRELARAAWKAFGADPDWQAARQESEKAGRLLVKQGVESIYMAPTDYSPTRE